MTNFDDPVLDGGTLAGIGIVGKKQLSKKEQKHAKLFKEQLAYLQKAGLSTKFINNYMDLYNTKGWSGAQYWLMDEVNRLNEERTISDIRNSVARKRRKMFKAPVDIAKEVGEGAWEGVKEVGEGVGNAFMAFGNALLAGDSGVGTSMAIASGYQYNPETKRWEQSEQNLKEAEGLRNNLSVLSTFSETHPYNVALKGLGYLLKWRPFLPKGSETTVYRQGGLDMVDDALQSGVVKPQPEANYAAKVAADKAAGARLIFRKQFKNVMFNRQLPFYGNPGLFQKTTKKGVFVGDMNKSSALWIQNFHKGHKKIFEPFMDGIRQAPVSEFDIYTRAPLNFGWFKNIHKSTNSIIPFGIVPQYTFTTDKQ